MTEKICAVVVTFNRKELLKECLRGLLDQTHAMDAILIIDNASTDNTAELLLHDGFIDKLPPVDISEPFVINSKKKTNQLVKVDNTTDDNAINTRIELDIVYVRMHINTGGAGGFYEGQKMAYNQGFDWIWLMDDDGEPSHCCLSKLLNKSNSELLKAVNPLVIDKLDNDRLSFGLSSNIMTVKEAENNKNSNGLISLLANPFNGTLLHRSLIEKIGFIKKEMFIWGDETEYFQRIEKYGFSFATVVNAVFYHPTSKTIYKKKVFGLLKMASKPERLEMNFYRNQGYLNMKYKGLYAHKVLFINVLFSILDGKFKKSLHILKYYLDGVRDEFKLPNIR